MLLPPSLTQKNFKAVLELSFQIASGNKVQEFLSNGEDAMLLYRANDTNATHAPQANSSKLWQL